VLEARERLVGVGDLGEVDGQQTDDQTLGLERHGETRAVARDAADERIVDGQLLSREHDRLPVSHEVVDVARLAGRGAPEEALDAVAFGADAQEDRMGRCREPRERRVGAGHRGAPPRGPTRRLRQVLAERELGEGGDLRVGGAGEASVHPFFGILRIVFGDFGFVRHGLLKRRQTPDTRRPGAARSS
jgi:hypothetical protein